MRTILGTPEIEPVHPRDRQTKWIGAAEDKTAHNELFQWRHADKLSQIYLSDLAEPFSLRLRHNETTGDYSALLESRPEALRQPAAFRAETAIDAQAFAYYRNLGAYPVIEKVRAQVSDDTTIDWFREEAAAATRRGPLVEIKADTTVSHSEHRILQAGQGLLEVTNILGYYNEWIAYERSPSHSEQFSQSTETVADPAEITEELLREISDRRERGNNQPYVLGISGRSGSGKSTLARDIEARMCEQDVGVMCLSTDDYHRGKSWLLETFGVDTWENWDADVVYNTDLLAWELNQHLGQGEPIPKRRFDFSSEEPVVEEASHQPAEVVLVEGLYPHASSLESLIDKHVRIPTPVATSIGRRILRDINPYGRLNDSLGSASDILRYQLETAEPTYRKHQ